jgi:type II secretory pathway pseudopilin PulG
VIIGLVAAAAIYNWIFRIQFVAAPQQEEAANEMFVAQQNFQKQLME